MKFNVYELPKAKRDKRHIFEWLFERSPQGALAWLDAYDQMVERLKINAETLPLAQEQDEVDLQIRQILFKTRRGRVYRVVFHIEDAGIYILRVRGPGQAPVSDDHIH